MYVKIALMQCSSQGVYCGLSSASEVFLNFTTNYMHVYDITTSLLPHPSHILLNVREIPSMQCDSEGVYCGLSTASEMILNFTTQLYACL